MYFVYVACGSGGAFKVGCTASPKRRRTELAAAFRAIGQRLVRISFTSRSRNASRVERAILDSLQRQGVSKLKGREWFSGADFDSTMQLAHRLAIFDSSPRFFMDDL